MKYLLATIAVIVIPAGVLSAQQTDFRLTVSGALADKLASDTRVCFWSPLSDTSDLGEFAITDLPITVPFDRFKGHQWNVVFLSNSTRSSFSVTLSRDLFDRPRLINVKLDAPRPHIRPIFMGSARDVRYTASITKRMRYYDLPQWDSERECLTRSTPPPMKITSLCDGTVIYDSQMVDGCTASRWFAFIDRNANLHDGETYRMTVMYNSGGLFPPITTTRDFTYHVALHGK